MMKRFFLTLVFLASFILPVFAVNPDEMLADPGLESRARALSAELRCLVCQNQSIDDSDAELARDLRLLVRDRLKAGDNDDQVLQFIVDRYGEFVLLRPVLAPHTIFLWLAAPAVLMIGFIVLLVAGRKRHALPDEPALTQEEKAVLETLEQTPPKA